jgi:hypothetical protein
MPIVTVPKKARRADSFSSPGRKAWGKDTTPNDEAQRADTFLMHFSENVGPLGLIIVILNLPGLAAWARERIGPLGLMVNTL